MWLRVWKTLSLGLGHFPKRLICLRDACHILEAQVEEKSHLSKQLTYDLKLKPL